MPVIQLVGGKLHPEAKAALIREFTHTASRICGIPEASYTVTLTELDDDNLGFGGRTVTEIKAARAITES